MHVAPRAANTQDVQHPVQKAPIILGWTGLPPTLCWQKRFNNPPLGICQISASQSYLLKGSLESYRS
jgi:hypothetical protein